ncbi:hypothetical protein WI40_13385 [Burkholderia ubonensis]|uniref:hypothetical protein n=1 Tax=Burkholderia ubonensis TaxID=101571 RepID=UPI00075EB421|nr:hypothetical protein [Burkholderia ubonensis]KUZ71619.1 hypothetical protein WI37_25605 [Burkholderia ubonensis]KUZ98502.1 hypothetical protein WI40_13385 [Burkholderia ubonensis]KVT98506.1 hypothetical protein WK60_00165 [Burkholderia ubonensis]KVU41510.1 hypothetical protein WK68_12020 [Burkholderia ubonensis]
MDDMLASELLPMIRAQVRAHLLAVPAYRALPKEKQMAVAHDTVKAIHFIVGGEDGRSRPNAVQLSGDSPVVRQLAASSKPALPEGDTAGQRFAQSGAIAAQQGTDAFTGMVTSINFPKFVAGLIDGVFNAIVTASIKQMEAYVELVANVSKSVDQFMKDNVTENNARDYLTSKYPNVFELDVSGDKPAVKPRDGLDRNNLPDFHADLGVDEDSALSPDAIEEKLVPAARRRIAMDRQQLLATMVMMGVNRLVVTNGNIEASCMFELNTKDEVRRRMNQKTTADWAAIHEAQGGSDGSSSRSGSGFLGLGDDTDDRSSWFTKSSARDTASFNVATTRSEDSDAKVELHAKLAGKVNLQFKSDYFPMEKMVDAMQINQIKSRTPSGSKEKEQQPTADKAVHA